MKASSHLPESNFCSACNGLVITDSSIGEMLCSSCGIVIREKLETFSPEWRSFSPIEYDDKVRTGFPSSLLIHDTGLSTYIGSSLPQPQSQSRQQGEPGNNEQESKAFVHQASTPIPINRLRKLNAMSISSTPASRNLKRASWEINRICSILGLTLPVAERSAYFYRKALQKNLIKGRSIAGFVVASIYLACKEKMIPRTIEEVCRASGTDKPFAAHCYKVLVSEMHIDPPLTDPFRNISKISTRAGIEERISRRAREILSSISSQTLIMGKNPIVLAAAALYLASMEYGMDITKTVIADAAEVSTISLRKRLKDITFAMQNIKHENSGQKESK